MGNDWEKYGKSFTYQNSPLCESLSVVGLFYKQRVQSIFLSFEAVI